MRKIYVTLSNIFIIYNNSKINFIKLSKFTICPENSADPGYCTEKIMHALEAGCIPLYWGIDLPEKDILKEVSNYKEKGNEIGYAFAELSKPDECEKAVNGIIKEFGRIDGLVNNAGINDGIGLENGNYEDFLSSIKNNLAHYYKMAQLVLPELKKNKGLSLIHI